MSTHKHTYQRLSDDAVFCRDCGDIKRSEPPVCTLPHYQPTWIYYPPIYPTVVPWRPTTVPYWYTVSSGTSDTRLLSDGSSITYTAES